MPRFPDEPPDERRRQYMAETTLELVRRTLDGDELASEVLQARYENLLRRWARTRWSSNSTSAGADTPTQDSPENLVSGATHHTLGRLRELELEREATLLVHMRDAVYERIGTLNGASDALETTMGAQTASDYETSLKRLDPPEREAIVSVLEFQRSFEQLADALNVASAELARDMYLHAVVHLAEEMGHGR